MNVLLKDGPLAGKVFEGLLDTGHRLERSIEKGRIAVYTDSGEVGLATIVKRRRGADQTFQQRARIYTFVGERTEANGWKIVENS